MQVSSAKKAMVAIGRHLQEVSETARAPDKYPIPTSATTAWRDSRRTWKFFFKIKRVTAVACAYSKWWGAVLRPSPTSAKDRVSDSCRERVVSPPRRKRPRIRLDVGSYKKPTHEVLERDGWRCKRCGCSSNLQVQRTRPRSSLGPDVEEDLMTLCARCYRHVHLSHVDLSKIRSFSHFLEG